jgi:hypothetical protein
MPTQRVVSVRWITPGLFGSEQSGQHADPLDAALPPPRSSHSTFLNP